MPPTTAVPTISPMVGHVPMTLPTSRKIKTSPTGIANKSRRKGIKAVCSVLALARRSTYLEPCRLPAPGFGRNGAGVAGERRRGPRIRWPYSVAIVRRNAACPQGSGHVRRISVLRHHFLRADRDLHHSEIARRSRAADRPAPPAPSRSFRPDGDGKGPGREPGPGPGRDRPPAGPQPAGARGAPGRDAGGCVGRGYGVGVRCAAPDTRCA